MESQHQYPEFRINPENFQPCICCVYSKELSEWEGVGWEGRGLFFFFGLMGFEDFSSAELDLRSIPTWHIIICHISFLLLRIHRYVNTTNPIQWDLILVTLTHQLYDRVLVLIVYHWYTDVGLWSLDVLRNKDCIKCYLFSNSDINRSCVWSSRTIWKSILYLRIFPWAMSTRNLCNPYPTTIFLSWKCCLLFMPAAYIQVHFRLDFIIEANTMNPDQTAPKGAVWSGSILFTI